jgi:dual specificity phosphatase 12
MSNVSEIIDGVYVGNMYTAKDAAFFRDKNIRRVVNCTPDVPFYFSHVTYMRIKIDDSPDVVNNEIMKNAIPYALDFIMKESPGKDNGVLIHCHAGVSRSCTIAVALLRVCCATSLDMATAMLLAKRPIAFFNGTFINFKKALEGWERRLYPGSA